MNVAQKNAQQVMAVAREPLVSVVIPCYRQSHFLAQAIDSVLRQTHRQVEVIVVNDGSDDATDSVVAQYEGAVRYVWQPNGGLASARNAGLRTAQGQYVLFLDADDILHDEAIERHLAGIDGHPRRVSVMWTKSFFDEPSEAGGFTWEPSVGIDFLPGIIHDNYAPPHGYLSPKAFVENVGGFDAAPIGNEDWDLWSRLALNGAELVVTPRVGAFYRRYATSMSNDVSLMTRGRCIVLLRLHREMLNHERHLADFGAELFDALHRLHRRLIVSQQLSDLVPSVRCAIEQLRQRKIRHSATAPRRLAEAVVGYWATEAVALPCLRWLRPSAFK